MKIANALEFATSSSYSSIDYGIKRYQRATAPTDDSFIMNDSKVDSIYGTFENRSGASTELNKKQYNRKRSIAILLVLMLITNVQMYIYWKSIWPFLYSLDPMSHEAFSGWIITMSYVAAGFASPFFGYWSGRIKSAKLPIIIGLIISGLGSLIVPYTELFPQQIRKWILLSSRVIVGIGTGTRGVMFAAVSMCSEESERSKNFAIRTAVCTFSFMLAPLIQASMVPIGYPGYQWPFLMKFDMYTASAFVSILLSIFGISLVAWGYSDIYVSILDPNSIEEENVLAIKCNEDGKQKTIVAPKNTSHGNYDKFALIIIGCVFFCTCFCLSFDESVASPFSMVIFDWTQSAAIAYNAIIEISGACLSIAIQLFLARYVLKRFQLRYLNLIGCLFFACFIITTTPWPVFETKNRSQFLSSDLFTNLSNRNNLYTDVNNDILSYRSTHNGIFNQSHSGNDVMKSPEKLQTLKIFQNNFSSNDFTTIMNGHIPCKHDWCISVPTLPLPIYILSYIFLYPGITITYTVAAALFSAVIGPHRQERWMSYFTICEFVGSGLAPIVGTIAFEKLGPRDMWCVCGAGIGIGLTLIAVFFRRLIPWSERQKNIIYDS